jgi:flagellum-specific peptidoglycan hydrolase FlgJ
MTIFYKIALVLYLTPKTQEEYTIKYYPVAKACEYFYGVPVEIQLAQALVESGGGVSYIGKNSNNHFGIKYYPEAFRGECFTDRIGVEWRKYNTVIEGYIDHAKFLSYHYKSVCFKPYTEWERLIGYGESGSYWKHIIKIAKSLKL